MERKKEISYWEGEGTRCANERKCQKFAKVRRGGDQRTRFLACVPSGQRGPEGRFATAQVTAPPPASTSPAGAGGGAAGRAHRGCPGRGGSQYLGPALPVPGHRRHSRVVPCHAVSSPTPGPRRDLGARRGRRGRSHARPAPARTRPRPPRRVSRPLGAWPRLRPLSGSGPSTPRRAGQSGHQPPARGHREAWPSPVGSEGPGLRLGNGPRAGGGVERAVPIGGLPRPPPQVA